MNHEEYFAAISVRLGVMCTEEEPLPFGEASSLLSVLLVTAVGLAKKAICKLSPHCALYLQTSLTFLNQCSSLQIPSVSLSPPPSFDFSALFLSVDISKFHKGRFNMKRILCKYSFLVLGGALRKRSSRSTLSQVPHVQKATTL